MVDNHFESISCVICDTNNTNTINTVGQFDLPANVVVCSQCGLSYLNPRWTKAKLVDFYTQDYDTYYRPNMSDSNEASSTYVNVLARLKKEQLIGGHIKKILDVGSGEGTNLAYLKKQIPNASFFAIEPSTSCQETLRRMGVDILTSDIDSEIPSAHFGSFDLIVMRHVLEHMDNPIEVIKKATQLLSEKGILYIAVPNSLKTGKYSLRKSWFRVVHNYYFNVHTLKNVIAKGMGSLYKIYDGDSFSEQELIAIVQKGNPEPLHIDPKLYYLQNTYFKKRLKIEKSYLYKIKTLLGRIIGKK